MENVDYSKPRRFRIFRRNELYFEVPLKSEKVSLELKEGDAEIFGLQLTKNELYEFSAGTEVSVFSWHGCTMHVLGKTEHDFISKESFMTEHFESHGILERQRITAEFDDSQGPPSVIVVGPCDFERYMVSMYLTNYAIRDGRTPIFIDLDLQGRLAVPGTLAMFLANCQAFNELKITTEPPIMYSFGHDSPDSDELLYEKIVNKLVYDVNDLLDKYALAKTSGMIINTSKFVGGGNYKHILNASRRFEAKLMIILDKKTSHYNDLLRDLPCFTRTKFISKEEDKIKMMEYPRLRVPENVDNAEPSEEEPVEEVAPPRLYSKFHENKTPIQLKSLFYKTRMQQIQKYFYGVDFELDPYTFMVNWSDISIVKINGTDVPDPDLLLYLKMQQFKNLKPVTPGPEIQNHLLAVSVVDNLDPDMEVIVVTHFVCIKDVDDCDETIEILSTQPPPLPKKLLLLMNAKFID